MKFTLSSASASVVVCSGVLWVSATAAERKEGRDLVCGGRPSEVLLQQRIPTDGVFCARVSVKWPVVRRGGKMPGSQYEYILKVTLTC